MEDGVTRLTVKNENFFKDIDNVRLQWSLVENGKVVKQGTIDELACAPQATVAIELPVGRRHLVPTAEYYLNVDFTLKAAEPLKEAGQVVAYGQHLLNKGTAQVAETAVSGLMTVADGEQLTVSAEGVEVAFDKTTGLLSRYQVGGVNLLGNGGTLRPNFWRAPVDNDYGADTPRKYKVWRAPKLELQALEFTPMKRANVTTATVTARYALPEVEATLQVVYAIGARGDIRVTQSMTTTPEAKVSDLFRFGMVMEMPYYMDNAEYYGRGPVENYIDRYHSQRVGIYKETARSAFFPYVRPQETGTKTDIRWWKQLSTDGVGLLITGEEPLSMSALHFTIDELDDGDEKDQRHPTELNASKFTNVCIDKVQGGVGGINSWFQLPLEKHRLHYQDRSYSFTLKPVKAE